MAESGLDLELLNRWDLSSLVSGATSAADAQLSDPRTWHAMTYILLAIVSLGCRFLMRSAALWAKISRETLLLLPAVFLYFLVRGAVETRWVEASAHSDQIIALERTLGIFREPKLQGWITSRDILVDLANWVYIWGHWPFITAVTVWLCVRHGEAYFVYRNALLISGAIGLVVFSLYPVAPPRFLSEYGFVDTITLQSRAYRVLQPPAFTNPYAAMPSLHFGWDLLFSLAIIQYSRFLLFRVVGVLMPLAMFLSIILTANHFILDGVAGALVAMVGLAMAMGIARCARPKNVEARSDPRSPGWAGAQRKPILVERSAPAGNSPPRG